MKGVWVRKAVYAESIIHNTIHFMLFLIHKSIHGHIKRSCLGGDERLSIILFILVLTTKHHYHDEGYVCWKHLC